MSKIRLLSEAVCNRIAAGEVVERPASVVKELVENSLDAGATRIVISVEKGGRKLISVQDNGEGMDPDDALLCLETHATSKISEESDIFAISSFGFRGEALPSIASVSKTAIRTRRKDAPEGVEVVVHGSKMISSDPVGCAPGTLVTIRDLFYNVPARLKFMRAIATEERHISEAVTNISLANPHVSFELIFDGKHSFSSPASDNLIPRIRELFGKEFSDVLVPVSKNEYGIQVTGFVSKRSYTRPSRQDQRIFVNARPIESAAVYRGIREGCGPTLDKGRHQAAILFITMNPSSVDVNVHPTKKEVRFRNEFEVVSAVRSAVTSALRIADPVIPYTPGQASGDFTTKTVYSDYPNRAPYSGNSAPAVQNAPLPPSLPGMGNTLAGILKAALIEYNAVVSSAISDMRMPHPQLNIEPGNDAGENMAQGISSGGQTNTFFGGTDLRILGIFENSYIVGAIPGGMVFIDQHAAHERVLFERILKGVDTSLSQRLLIPVTVEFSRSDAAFIVRNSEIFEQLGFEIESFGENTIKLNGIPAALPQDNAGGIFQDTVARILESGGSGRVETDQIARAACKAAVKAHDRLSVEEAEALIRDMGKCEMPFSCPHGRPTVLNISLNEIERRFGRK